MRVRRKNIFYLALFYVGCLTPGPCEFDYGAWKSTYYNPVTVNFLKGCWDALNFYNGVWLRDTLNLLCFGDSTMSQVQRMSTTRLAYFCANYSVFKNLLSDSNSVIDLYELVSGNWQLDTSHKSPNPYSNNITTKNDTLVYFTLTSNQEHCGNPVVGENRRIKHTGKIDSSGILHCDSLGYR